jgi:hypothetical protein
VLITRLCVVERVAPADVHIERLVLPELPRAGEDPPSRHSASLVVGFVVLPRGLPARDSGDECPSNSKTDERPFPPSVDRERPRKERGARSQNEHGRERGEGVETTSKGRALQLAELLGAIARELAKVRCSSGIERLDLSGTAGERMNRIRQTGSRDANSPYPIASEATTVRSVCHTRAANLRDCLWMYERTQPTKMPTPLDNGRRSPRNLLRGVVARLLGRKP